MVFWINKWYINIFWGYNRKKHHLIIINFYMVWQEGYGMVFCGILFIDVIFKRF